MRLLIVYPSQDRATGNRATADRLRRGMERLGHCAATCPTPLDPAAIRRALIDFRPEATLLLHAYRGGRPWLEAGGKSPFLVLLTGTDLNEGTTDPIQGPVIREVLRRAGAILLQNPLLAADFLARRPDEAGRLHHLPPGVELGSEPFDLRRRLGVPKDRPLFLFPAGLRPVKNQRDLLELFARLPADTPDFHLAFCGPVLDEDYARDLLEAIRVRDRFSWLGVIPPEAMASAMREADVVVNHSLAEGLPNTLAEAAVLGIPILAREIPGNAAVVEHGRNGLLYRDAEGFARCAARLIADPALRARLSRPDPERFAPGREARALETICLGVLDRASRGE